MKKHKDDHQKKKRRVGWKGIVFAMIIAILSLFGFGWNGTQQSGGNGDSGQMTESGEVSDDETELSQEEEAESVDKSDGKTETDGAETDDTSILSIYIAKDLIYLDESMQTSITLEDLQNVLETYTGQQVALYDEGALNKTYEEVSNLIDTYEIPTIKY